MCLVLACRSTCRRACALCWHADQRAGVHVPRAGMQNDVHACTCLVLACRTACRRACASCRRAERCASVHVPRAGMQNGVPACMSLVLACRMTCTRPYPRAGLHIDVHACAWNVQAFRGGILGFEMRCMLAVLMCTCSHFSTLGEQPPLQTRKARLQANNCHCKPRKRDCRATDGGASEHT